MYEIDRKLLELEEKQTPIHVSLIGCGQMGKDIIAQISKMKGIVCDIVIDIQTDVVLDGYGQAGYSAEDIVVTEDLKEAEEAVRAGKKVASSDYKLAAAAERTQVVIDATGSPEMGARITLECIFHKKHIVMMNVECDVTIGPILRKLCEQAGIVYSLTAGDEPGSICEIYRFAKSLGFKVVAAGKGKNNPLNFYATPDKMAARMLVEFVDGSKTMIEMAAVSNATGLVPDVRGMHCAKCNVDELKTVFSLKSQGGVLEKEGVVDFAIGNVAPGVFVVVTTDNQRIIDGLVQRDMGEGPNYLLYRPYHLCSIETPITAAQAVIYGESSGHPMDHLTSECITIAKKDLKKGEVLDSIGEFCYRASIDLHSTAREGNMLPVGLAKGAVMKCDAAKDTVITYDMVELSEKSVLVQLRRIQDQMLA